MSRRILIYGDVNLNYRDGSAVWLVSIAECLAKTGSEVHLLLKADVIDVDSIEYLQSHSVNIHTPFDDRKSGFSGMTVRQAAYRIVQLDRRHNYDIVLSRGYGIASQLAVSSKFTGRMWPYLTEGPAFAMNQTTEEQRILETIGLESRRIFAQTEEARSIIEVLVPSFTGKVLLMNPIIPDIAFEIGRSKIDEGHSNGIRNLHMVYSGKFARLWRTLEMTTLPMSMAEHDVVAKLKMIGDKFQNTGNDAEWLDAMKSAATSDLPGVTWHGGVPRNQVLSELGKHDVGLCWRDPELDSSPEISTKMLEYAAVGTPPVLNRSSMHERLLGSSYPLFVEGDDVMEPLLRVAKDPATLALATSTAAKAVETFSMTASVARFNGYFTRSEADSNSSLPMKNGRKRLRVVLAGHDFKFAGELIEVLTQRKDIDLIVEKWSRLNQHDENRSLKLAKWADVVICEWAGPNAVYYSRHLSAQQKLLVRFHGFEIRGDWLNDIDIDNVQAVIFVSDFYRKQVLRRTGWPEHKSTVVYNAIDVLDLKRPKPDNARFHIGMAGYVPMLKRPDRAIDILRLLLDKDDRFYLHFKGREPWLYPWEWQKPAQQESYKSIFERLRQDTELSQHVIFEPFGPDMGNWFRRIGWMLSPSTRETFHLAPVEAMASGAIPVVWNREGANEIFGDDYVHIDSAEASRYILSNLDKQNYDALAIDVQRRSGKYDLMRVREQWSALLTLSLHDEIPLWGTSIIAGKLAPDDQADAVALYYRKLKDDGARAAVIFARRYRHLLPESILNAVNMWDGIISWLSDPRAIIPAVKASPIYTALRERAMVVGVEPTELNGYATRIVAKAPKSVGRYDYDILIAADAFVRLARRERPAAIYAEGSVFMTLAALIAARRLGITFVCGSISINELKVETADIERELLALIKENAGMATDGCRPPESSELSSAKPEIPLESVKVGLIADEFTATTISASIQTVELSRERWHTQIQGLDAIIVESAWEGRGLEWFHGIAYHGDDEFKDFLNLVEECRNRDIPLLFWNKEDPVHFRSFARAASECDYVFTTDAAKIVDYLRLPDSKIRSVSSLPFYAEPSLHNPLPVAREYSDTISFAGTFYGDRYPARSAELEKLLDVSISYGLTIYDRQRDRPDSPYQFPAKYLSNSVGSVPYGEMLEIYKSHPIHLNVNSVADSPSMFSRRVVEIAASGSVVASGTGRGIKETLGNAFEVFSGAQDWNSSARIWMNDETKRLDIAWGQMRSVFNSHRADQALALMLRTAGLAVRVRRLPKYALYVDSVSQVLELASQTLAPTILSQDGKIVDSARCLGLEASQMMDESIEYYGTYSGEVVDTYYEDLLIATYFSNPDVITTAVSSDRSEALIQFGRGDLSTGLVKVGVDLSDPNNYELCWRISGHVHARNGMN